MSTPLPPRRGFSRHDSVQVLALCMVTLGVLVGLSFPPMVVLLDVADADAADRPVFRAVCVAAGVVVAGLNMLLVRLVLGRRLRRLARGMQAVASALAHSGDTVTVTASHRVPVLSRDAFAAPAVTFNDVVDALERTLVARRALEDELRVLAEHDGLTGLLNRASWTGRVQAELAHPDVTAFSVLLIDLDRFKEVNDDRGHAAGDEVLRETARRLLARCRPDDAVARIGGDEFVVLLRGCAAEEARGWVERLVDDLSLPVGLPSGTPVTVGASIGLAVRRSPTDTAGSLLHDADVAMYRQKSCTRGS